MKITIEDNCNNDQLETLLEAIFIYKSMKKHLDENKNIKIRIDQDNNGAISQHGKYIPFLRYEKK